MYVEAGYVKNDVGYVNHFGLHNLLFFSVILLYLNLFD